MHTENTTGKSTEVGEKATRERQEEEGMGDWSASIKLLTVAQAQGMFL